MTTTAEQRPSDGAITDADAVADVVGGTEDAGGIGVADSVLALGRAAVQSRAAAVKAGVGLSAEAVKIALGRSQVEPARGDGRFADPAWSGNPGYRRVEQAYLAWCGAVDSVVEAADVDWRTRERARFAAGILTSTLAPTNTLPGNPAALKRVIETGGGSLVRRHPPLRRRPAPQRRHAPPGRPERVHGRREHGGDAGRRRLPRRGLRGHPVPADHTDGAGPAGRDDPAADQQVLLHGSRPRAQLHRVRQPRRACSSSSSPGATPARSTPAGTSTPTAKRCSAPSTWPGRSPAPTTSSPSACAPAASSPPPSLSHLAARATGGWRRCRSA